MEYNFFPAEWFAGSYFPPVWFAPSETESPVVVADGGGAGKPPVRKGVNRPAWIIPQKFNKPTAVDTEEDAAVLLCCL